MSEVNFDLERMKKAIEGPYITIPEGLTRKQIREFILGQAKRIEREGGGK